MKTNEFLILKGHLERLFGEPFHGFEFHPDDDTTSVCAGCHQIWVNYHALPKGKHINTIRIDIDGPKLTFWIPEEYDDKSVSVNLADPESDKIIKQVLDASLRF